MELIQRGEIEAWEIENGIRRSMDEHAYIGYDGIYNVFMAGELRTESVIPDLVKILDNDEGDIVLEEVTRALVKIGSATVIDAVEKVALHEYNCFYSIDVLAKIKSKAAEEVLLRLFEQTDDLTSKTMIADALCQQLSVKAIPLVEKLLVEGYDSGMLNLEESLYANLVMNEVNHPYLQEMKRDLEEEESRFNNRKQTLAISTPVQTEKIGRNDPCPCGSGKKYKKCCL